MEMSDCLGRRAPPRRRTVRDPNSKGKAMKICDFRLSTADFGIFGQGLQRPECVWLDNEGVWASDARGGVARVKQDDDPELPGTGIVDANGFSRRPDGSFVVAGIGDGGLHAIARDGTTRLF